MFFVQWWLIGPAGRSNTLVALRVDARLAGGVGEAQHRVGVGHVEVAADQRHAERRVQARQQHAARLGDAVAVGVAQQGDAVGARHAGAGARHHLLHDPALDALAVLGLGRGVGLGDEHVAVGQHEQPARMVEAGGERLHREAGGGRGPRAGGPADGGRDVDGGDERGLRRRQRGRRAGAGLDGQAGDVAAGGEGEQARRRRQRDGAAQAQGGRDGVIGGVLPGS